MLPMASKCMINKLVVTSSMKAGTDGSINIATTIPQGSDKATIVTDLAKQCPGDNFRLECNPTADYMKYDPKTGKASIKIPTTIKANLMTHCKIEKKSADGKYEYKKFELTAIPAAKSVCRLEKGIDSFTMKAGEKKSGMIATFHDGRPIKDILKDCPGDRFLAECTPKLDWFEYVVTTGMGNIYAPTNLKENVTVGCTYTKRALNGEVEEKKVKITIEAAPKSPCKINAEVQSSAMEGGSSSKFGMVTIFDKTTKKPMVVHDIKKQCPGDEFNMHCVPMPTYFKYDPANG